ncbi:MAG: hypothetical protein HYR70_02560 [Chloroflexi bacterium]|nr:hypothetical protein [Chloroflexota bacterium]MBI3339894.1 hypothetical protein [Chloroflexota bacterium]
MRNVPKFSQAEMILLTIYRLSKALGNRVPFEEIVVQVWKDFPEHFSLNNHPEYPDSYPVSKRIYSDLITERLVVSLRKQVYRLTDKGLDIAVKLASQSSAKSKEHAANVVQLNRSEDEFFQYAIKSRAFLAWKQGKGNDLIDYDARVFFQFSTGTPVRERKRKLENARDAVEKAVVLDIPDAKTLNDLFRFFTKKFPSLFEEN